MLYLLCPVYFDARQREGEARARQAKASDLCMSCHVRVCTYVRAYGRKAKDQAFIFFLGGRASLPDDVFYLSCSFPLFAVLVCMDLIFLLLRCLSLAGFAYQPAEIPRVGDGREFALLCPWG